MPCHAHFFKSKTNLGKTTSKLTEHFGKLLNHQLEKQEAWKPRCSMKIHKLSRRFHCCHFKKSVPLLVTFFVGKRSFGDTIWADNGGKSSVQISGFQDSWLFTGISLDFQAVARRCDDSSSSEWAIDFLFLPTSFLLVFQNKKKSLTIRHSRKRFSSKSQSKCTWTSTKTKQEAKPFVPLLKADPVWSSEFGSIEE